MSHRLLNVIVVIFTTIWHFTGWCVRTDVYHYVFYLGYLVISSLCLCPSLPFLSLSLPEVSLFLISCLSLSLYLYIFISTSRCVFVCFALFIFYLTPLYPPPPCLPLSPPLSSRVSGFLVKPMQDVSERAWVGADFFKLPEEKQKQLLSTGNMLFCRTEPKDKQRLVKMLQDMGEVRTLRCQQWEVESEVNP